MMSDLELVLSSRADTQTYGGLSKRELEVVQMAAYGNHTQEIADVLHISKSTAAKHLEHAYRKLGVERLQCAVVALRQRYGVDLLATPCTVKL